MSFRLRAEFLPAAPPTLWPRRRVRKKPLPSPRRPPLPVLLFCAALGLGAPARANDAPDYGPALALFDAFGLPPLDPDARYAALSLQNRDPSELQPFSSFYQCPLLGKGWVCPATNDRPARFLFLAGLGGPCRTQGASAAPSLPLAAWNTAEADIRQDVDSVLRLLRPPDNDTGQTEEEGGEQNDDATDDEAEQARQYLRHQIEHGDAGGALLLAAAHFRQAGLESEANEIVHLVFQMAVDRPPVVRHAVEHLARLQFADASARLTASRDWQAYRNDLQSLLDRFRLAWDKAPALDVLIGNVDRRLAGEIPAGDGLDDEAARFFAAMSPADLQLLHYMRLSIVLNPAIQLALLSDPEDLPGSRFLARGLHMIPPLLAVAESDFLLLPSLQPAFSSRSSSHRYSSDSEKALKSAAELYAELIAKPPALGATALDLLNVLVPLSEPASRSDNPADVLQAARAFYAAHAADSPLQLTRHYLANGNSAQRESALETLLKSPNPDLLALAETFLFSSNIWAQNTYSLLDHSTASQIEAYLAAHPERAPNALPPFVALLNEQIPQRLPMLNDSRREREADAARQFISRLAKLLEGQKPGEPLPVADGEPPEIQAHLIARNILAKSKGLNPQDAIGLFLDEIIARPDPALRQTLLSMMIHMVQYTGSTQTGDPASNRQNPYQRMQELGELFDDELFRAPDYAAQVAVRARQARLSLETASPSPHGVTPAEPDPAAASPIPLRDFAPRWEILLADTNTPPLLSRAHPFQMGRPVSTTVADSAAHALAAITLETQNFDPLRQTELLRLGPRLAPYWHRVARDILNGVPRQDLPALPAAAQADPAALSALLERLAAEPHNAAHLLREADPSLLLALEQAADQDKSLRAALAPAANRIRGIDDGSDPSLAPLLQPFTGARLSTNLFHDLLLAATACATQSLPASLSFQRDPWLDGAVLVATTNVPDYVADNFRDATSPNRALIQVFCQSLNTHADARWTVHLSPPPPPP
ncbi:MAG: hypothetical protein GX548_12435, partial [Lentisphaerae bacterium]|nr:hypothetical protein [Lentisphaerota bacterium]